MRPICWLHISDFHLRPADEWSQDVVLESMCQNIKQQHDSGTAFDFVLVTGDIAFSGKAEEYAIAKSFFKELELTSGVPLDRIFCVPGNHDVDRSRQSLCFRGARTMLSSQNHVDNLLAGGEDLDTLLTRQENYRNFQSSFFATQDRVSTEDGLGYVSMITIEDIRLAIVGLNSAWLAEGGVEDHGKLLVGERQLINAMRLAQAHGDAPHIVIGMTHHPLHLLQEFDRSIVLNFIEERCHFFHCGHLHTPTTSLMGPGGSGCLTVAAGAAFESRDSHNAYSIVKLDLRHGSRTVQVYRYNHLNRTFSETDAKDYPIEITPLSMCGVSELASAIESRWPELQSLTFYLASILLGKKKDLPIPTPEGYIFGSIEVMQDQPKSALKHPTIEFITFTNVLRVLYERESLTDIISNHGDPVGHYGQELISICESNSGLWDRLKSHNRDSQILAGSEPQESFSHTLNLFEELASSQEWCLLRDQGRRHSATSDPNVAVIAKRYMALALANSDEQGEKVGAIEQYRSLSQSEGADFTDFGNLASLLFEGGRMDEAGDAVLNGIRQFPEKRTYYVGIGHRIVEATGDRQLRLRLEGTTEEQA